MYKHVMNCVHVLCINYTLCALAENQIRSLRVSLQLEVQLRHDTIYLLAHGSAKVLGSCEAWLVQSPVHASKPSHTAASAASQLAVLGALAATICRHEMAKA